MNLKVKKLSSIIMLMIMVLSIFSPYSNLSATTVTSEVVSEIKSDDISELEESSEVKSDETIFVDNVDEYNSLIDNEKNETLIVSKEDLLKQPRASYNVEKYPHPTLIIEDFSSRFGQLMYFRVNGDIVFCIEATKNVDGIAYDQSESGSYFSSLPYSVQDQIEYFSAYGISKYKETGNKNYLWATQLLIWKAIEPSKYNVTGGTSLQPEINEINALVYKHFDIPSFMGTTTNNAPTHKLKWNGTKYTITLTDSNKVANYKLDSLNNTYGDYTISKSGNSITVSTSNHNASRKSIVPQYTPYNAGQNKYYDGGQDVFQGSADPLPMYMNVEIEPALGKIKIVKTGKELDNLSNKIDLLEGAKFELLDLSGKVVRSGTTNAKGELEFIDLLQGQYIVKEANAPNGYLVAPAQKVVVKPNETTIVNITDERATGNLEITKHGENLDSTNDKIEVLSNAEFELLDSLGTVVRTGTTNELGKLFFNDLLIGNYLLREVGAPTGYLIAVDKDVTIETGKTTSVTIVDEKISGKAKLHKIGKVNERSYETLKGVEFSIHQDANLDGYYETFIGNYFTDNKGQMMTDYLDFGNYIAEEVSAVDNYFADFKQEFKIRTNGEEVILSNYNDSALGGDIVLNQKIVAEIELTKHGESFINGDDSFSALKGAEFKAIEDIDTNGKYDMLDKLYAVAFPDTTQTLVTDSNGKAKFTNLDSGKSYLVFETKAPEGYALDTTVYPINKDIDHIQVKNLITYKLDVNNSVIRGQVELLKVGSKDCDTSISKPGEIKDCQTVLENVDFNIYNDLNKNGVLDKEESIDSNIVETITTNEKGIALSKDLKYGEYLARESKGLDNYYINKSVFPFSISENGEIVKLNNGIAIENVEKLGKIQLLKVGSKNCDKSITKPGEIKECQTVLGNVDFNVYNDLNANGKLDEEEDSESNIVETITTNENGVATSGNLSLKPYLVREAKTLENYFINEYVFPVTLTEPDKVVKLNSGIAIENVEKLGQVKITKTGNEIGNLNDELVFLSNAEYTIYKRTLLSEDETGLDVNNELESEIDSDLNEVDTDSLYDDEIVAVLTTDMNGNAISPLLSFGNYYIQETNAPDGYVLDETNYEFTIDNDTYSEVIEFEFEDEVITNDIEITKTDLATGDELEGAKLQVLDSNGTIVEEWISTNEPHLFNLEYGDYIIMEEFAPEGYLPLLEGVKFSVTEDGIVQSFKIDNKLITNEISITKTDLATGDELAGARLQVLDSKGSIVEEWTSTTEAHEFTLPYGDYIIMEEFAPEGYLPLLEGVKFSVTEDGVKQSFKIENELMPVIEETGQNSYILIIFVSLIILVVLKYAINIRKAIPKLGETNE